MITDIPSGKHNNTLRPIGEEGFDVLLKANEWVFPHPDISPSITHPSTSIDDRIAKLIDNSHISSAEINSDNDTSKSYGNLNGNIGSGATTVSGLVDIQPSNSDTTSSSYKLDTALKAPNILVPINTHTTIEDAINHSSAIKKSANGIMKDNRSADEPHTRNGIVDANRHKVGPEVLTLANKPLMVEGSTTDPRPRSATDNSDTLKLLSVAPDDLYRLELNKLRTLWGFEPAKLESAKANNKISTPVVNQPSIKLPQTSSTNIPLNTDTNLRVARGLSKRGMRQSKRSTQTPYHGR